ncbi:MAG: hypothetical protein LUI06_07205 [Ruminococcus sp.]|nr:hypothetical protein [Ruminococcus sp.]
MRSGLSNSIMTKILVGLLGLLVLTMIGGQIYTYVTDRHDTQEAVLCTINEDISFDGIIVRDETMLSYSGSDVVSYVYSDGSKVSEGDVVANLYSSQEAALAQQRADEITEEIEQLERAQNPGTTDYVQPETISSKADDYYKQMISYANSGDYESLAETKTDITLILNIYNIISGISESYDARIAELSSELSELEAVGSAVDSITASMTGYFVSYCDGYEDELNTENVYDLTQSDIEDIIAGEQEAKESVPDSAVGKMFEDYSCLIVGVIEEDSRVAEDVTLQLTLDSTSTVYDVDVVSVSDAQEDGKIIVVLSCDYLDEAIASSRIQSMQLIFGEYSGLKVPRTALRFQGEEKGVYVILGEDITFKKVDVIYEGDPDEGDDFILSANTSDDNYLRLYDQILLEVVTEDDVQSSSSESADSDEVSSDT